MLLDILEIIAVLLIVETVLEIYLVQLATAFISSKLGPTNFHLEFVEFVLTLSVRAVLGPMELIA